MNSINKIIILSIIILLLNINNIKCSTTITFNNDIIFNCNITNPCDLSLKSVWLNNQVPINGDDVIIDLSNVDSNSSSSNVYLIAQNLNIQLNSFILVGQESNSNHYKTSLVILNSKLTVTTSFSISYSNLTLNDDNYNNNNNQVIINSLNSNQSNIIMDGYSILECNSTTLNGDSGTILIQGDSLLTVNDLATLNAPITHTSTGLLKFIGSTNINKILYSEGVVEFTGQVVITSQVIMNITLVGGNINITSSLLVILFDYIQLNQLASISVFNHSTLSILNSINSDCNLTNQINLFEGSSLFIPSGFNINNNNGIQMNGTIFIDDTLKVTTLVSVDQLNLNISSKSNITLVSSTLNSVSIVCYQASLNIKGSSSISNLFNIAETNILNSSSLSIISLTSSSSSSSIINISGTLSSNCNITSSLINIGPTGKLNSNSSIQISQYGSLVLSQNGLLFVNNSFTMDQLSTLQLDNATLNSNIPFIISNYIELNTIKLSIKFNNNNNTTKPTNNDKILLFKSYGFNNSNNNSNQILSNVYINITTSQINLSNATSYSYISYKIEKDSSGSVNLVFYDQEDPYSSYKVKIYCSVIGSIIGFTLLVVLICIVKRRIYRNHHHHYYYQNQYEYKSLLSNN